MEVLDGDVVRLSSRGREAERDIVQVSHSFPVSSIYIWSKNFSCLSNMKSEAKDGGN